MIKLYCSKCHKQSPDNFINCVYCGEKLESPKKKHQRRDVGKRKLELKFSFRTGVRVLLCFAAVLTVVALFTSTFVGSKPEKVVKSFVKSIQSADSDIYYGLYDDNIIRYKRDNRYFGDEETYEHIVSPMIESDAFYTQKCGEDYKLTYTITSNRTLSDEELEAFNGILENGFRYIDKASRVDVLGVEVIAKGSEGEYKSIYSDFWCMKIRGHWYRVDSTISAEFTTE